MLDLNGNRLHQRLEAVSLYLQTILTNKSVSKNTQPPLCYKFNLSQIEIGLITLTLNLLGENEDDIMVVDNRKIANNKEERSHYRRL
jgi:hypothetical protein